MDGPLGLDRLGWQLGVILLWLRMVAVGVRISSGYMMVTTYIAPWSWSLLMGEIPSNYGNLIDGICWMVRVYWVL